ncbi:MAG: hypothetical protein KDD42_00045, partial [Bdellovibrionales bacterium]|nr:hypothetical protein [Bdellovibrionales bacterium]
MLRNFFPILLVIFLTCSGCVRNPGLTTPQTGERLSWVAEEALVERLEGEATKLSSVRGLSRSRIEQNEERVALRHVIAYQQPDKLRIETLPSNVVQTLQLLILDGEEAIYLDASSKQGYRGPADSGLLRRFFGIALAPSKLMSLLSGRVPLESLALETKIFLDK